MRFTSRGIFVLLLVLIGGAIIGGLLGQVLSSVSLSGIVPYMTETYEIFNIQDLYLNLFVFQIRFGIRFAPNLISILGILIAAWLYDRL